MRKFLLAISVIFIAATVNAQPRAIGGRIGYGLDVSYQHQMGATNMIELDFGFPSFDGISAAVTYDWLFPITNWKEQGNWNLYAGVGGGLGTYFYNSNSHYYNFHVGVAGRFGVEYNFWFPLNLSIDYRPIIGPAFNNYGTYFYSKGFYSGAVAISARYIF